MIAFLPVEEVAFSDATSSKQGRGPKGGNQIVEGTYSSSSQGNSSHGSPRSRPILSYALWSVQGLLALVYLFAGGGKLLVSAQDLNEDFPMPDEFMRFIGAAEVLGAIGLILPGVLGIRPGLTPLAASGLVIIMACATVLTLADGDVAPALIPFVLGLLAAFVAYGRRSWLAEALAGTGKSSPFSGRTVTTQTSNTG
jgi:DoxX-like family